MKLVFPGGEHPQVLLGQGINRVGSDPAANIVLDQPGVQPQHCELHVTGHGVTLRVPAGTTVSVNNREVDGVIALRPGDVVAFDRVQARLATIEAAAPVGRMSPPSMPPANDDPEATAVRPVVPRYVLRGVAGEGFGRSYPVVGITTLGRAPDCNLRIEAAGLSRQHARLTPMNNGLLLEDLGSTNGCTINGKRVQRGLAAPGDEIGFDTLRFHLLAPAHPEAHAPITAPPPPEAIKPLSPWWWVGAAAVGLILVWIAAALR